MFDKYMYRNNYNPNYKQLWAHLKYIQKIIVSCIVIYRKKSFLGDCGKCRHRTQILFENFLVSPENVKEYFHKNRKKYLFILDFCERAWGYNALGGFVLIHYMYSPIQLDKSEKQDFSQFGQIRPALIYINPL